MSEHGADLLDHAVKTNDLKLMDEAAGVLEACYRGDMEYVDVGTVKNLGLAYVTMVQVSSTKRQRYMIERVCS